MTFEFIKPQDLFRKHAARLAEIGNDLKALIGYVKENEGFDHVSDNDIVAALEAEQAANGQGTTPPDYDAVLGVLQKRCTPARTWDRPSDDGPEFENDDYGEEPTGFDHDR